MNKYDIYKYYDIMLRRISHSKSNPYVGDNGRIMTIDELDKLFYKSYDTRVILSGKYVVITKYKGLSTIRKINIRTGEVIKIYSYDTKNMRDKYLRYAYSNEDILKTFVTLTFKETTDFEGVTKAFNVWCKDVKKTHPDFKFIKVLQRGHKGEKRPHFHLLTSLDIDDPILKIADSKKNNQYNLVNWNYGYSLVSRIKSRKEYKKIAYYMVQQFNVPVFKGKRNLSKSMNLIKPKVFYYDSRFDMKKINAFIKNAEVSVVNNYNDYFGSPIVSTEYRLISRDNNS